MPATIDGYSMVKFACLDDAFLEFFELETSPVEGRSLQQKDKKRKKGKVQKNTNKDEMPKDVLGHFPIHLKILISAHVRTKCCKMVERKACCLVLEMPF